MESDRYSSLYTDDLKLNAKPEKGVEPPVNRVRIFGVDVQSHKMFKGEEK